MATSKVKSVKYLDLLSKSYEEQSGERKQLLNDKATNQLSADLTEVKGQLLDAQEKLNNALKSVPFSGVDVIEKQNEVKYLTAFVADLEALKEMF